MYGLAVYVFALASLHCFVSRLAGFCDELLSMKYARMLASRKSGFIPGVGSREFRAFVVCKGVEGRTKWVSAF